MSRIILNALRAPKQVRLTKLATTLTPSIEKSQSVQLYHPTNYVRSLSHRSYSTTNPKNNPSREIIVESPIEDIVVPNQNLVELVFDGMNEEILERPALTCGPTGRSYNYGMMRMLVTRFAEAALSHCRLKPGDTIGLLLPNIPEFVIVCHGAMEAGIYVTFLNPLYTPNEIKGQFQNADVKLIVTVPQLLDAAVGIGSGLSDYHGTICIGGDDDDSRNVFGLESLLRAGHEAELPEVKPENLAVLPFSSGTTGVPKGVMLSHYNLVANLFQVAHPDIAFEASVDDPFVVFTVLPFFHIFGFNTILNSNLRMKMHLVTMPRFSPEDYIQALITYKPKMLFVVPSLMTFLTDNSNSYSLAERFKRKFGDQINVRQGYGMTETSPVTHLSHQVAPPTKHNTIGVPIPNTTARVVDLITGESLGPNKSGELQVKGPQVMMGYLKNEKATKETIDEDGWLHTGDIVYYDDDKYFYVIDRCKELIKVKGNQVSPTELEHILLEIPEVVDAAVVGVPDALADEVPKAFIVKKAGSEITVESISKYVNERVVHYKKLAGGIVFLESIPRNPSGKILRNELKTNESKYVKK
ncbi:hypothetical protein WA026_013926 [Henosepilachna vigintioctopunctata]|uniref:4-coumarate--CoA ligase n=1 Tax=Henosepilachna vigintioctopunctata TaxID=420089 RepID=A0AAW1TY69_9CUCU